MKKNISLFVLLVLLAPTAFAATNACQSSQKRVQTTQSLLDKDEKALSTFINDAKAKTLAAQKRYNDDVRTWAFEDSIDYCKWLWPDGPNATGCYCNENYYSGVGPSYTWTSGCKGYKVGKAFAYKTCATYVPVYAQKRAAKRLKNLTTATAAADRTCVSGYNATVLKYNRDADRYALAMTLALQCVDPSAAAFTVPYLPTLNSCSVEQGAVKSK